MLKNKIHQALYYNVLKDDLIRFAEKYGVALPKRVAKDKLIDALMETHYDSLYKDFEEFLYVPVWDVADEYSLTTEQVERLQQINVIKESYVEKEFFSRNSKSYYSAKTFPITILYAYKSDDLKKAYEEAYGGKGYRLRIETKTKNEIDILINQLDKLFEITKSPDSYEHRNEQGYYHYLTIREVNESVLKENAFRVEIENLKKEIEKLKIVHKEELQKFKKHIGRELGIEFNSLLDIIKFKNKIRSDINE